MWSPLDLLAARVENQGVPRQSPEADAEYLRRYNAGNSIQGLDPNAPGATANGGVPPTPAMAPAAPPPAPASDPTSGSGGFGGVGGAMSRAFSGEGVFGTADPSIDPMTGMPREIQRRANNQSIMKMGMMLMVAGMRNTDEGRAKMLAQLPGLMDNSDQVNNFAKTRLELAKVKLAEREMLTNEASSRAINAAITGGETTPMPGATVNPGGVAPVLDPSSGSGMAKIMPSMATAGATAAPTGSAPASDAPTASTPAPTPTLPLDAPPPPPPMPQFQVPSAIALMPPGPAKTQAYITAQREAMKAEYTSEPYVDTKLGKIVRDTYVAGRKTGRKVEGDLPVTIKDVEVDDQGTVERQHIQEGTGRIVRKETIIDPEHTEARVAATKRVTSDAEKYSKEYEETASPAVAGYERLGALAADVKGGKAITGTLAGARTWIANTMASAGFADQETLQRLQTGALVGQQLRRAAGEFAKQYYGPQVSNQDVINAEKVLNASMSNDKTLVAQALEEMQREARKKIEGYNKKADAHNERVSKVKHLDESLFSVPKIDYDFRPKEQPLTPAGGQPQPGGSGVRILRKVRD